MKTSPKFSRDTLEFLKKAARQKNPLWLERNRADYERLILEPLKNLALHLKKELGPHAPGYHFPHKGIGRLRRPSNKIEKGEGLYRGWMSYSASTPTGSRFDHNPNLYFLLNSYDAKDPVLVAGGMYVPSSRQTRAIREAIAEDASAFDKLFATKDFSRAFPGGFSDEHMATRPPRGFDPTHPRMDWLKLQAFFVWKPYSKRDFASPKFPELVARDFRQILKLNELLTLAIQGRLPRAHVKEDASAQKTGLLTRLGDLESLDRAADF